MKHKGKEVPGLTADAVILGSEAFTKAVIDKLPEVAIYLANTGKAKHLSDAFVEGMVATVKEVLK